MQTESNPMHKWTRRLVQAEQFKTGMRAKVEHRFNGIKNLFVHREISIRSENSARNAHRSVPAWLLDALRSRDERLGALFIHDCRGPFTQPTQEACLLVEGALDVRPGTRDPWDPS
jgi:hypothetical protein